MVLYQPIVLYVVDGLQPINIMRAEVLRGIAMDVTDVWRIVGVGDDG